jgi:short-subunit dehydrogenase
MLFSGKSVLITGASSGIGYMLAKRLAGQECKIAILARRTDILKEFAEKYSTGSNIILPLHCDISNKEEVYSSLETVIEKFGEIDIAILNAGTSYRLNAEDFSAEKGEKVISVNLTSKFYFLEKLIPYFIEKKSGMIVGVSSLADARGFPRSAFYNASKAAFSKLLESLRIELKSYGIKVITVRPGFVKTPMTDKNEFHMPFLIDVEKAVDIIIKGIEKEKRIIQFPLPTVISTKIIELMPDSMFEYFTRKHLEGLKKKQL